MLFLGVGNGTLQRGLGGIRGWKERKKRIGVLGGWAVPLKVLGRSWGLDLTGMGGGAWSGAGGRGLVDTPGVA
jgi:hypothetical protein